MEHIYDDIAFTTIYYYGFKTIRLPLSSSHEIYLSMAPSSAYYGTVRPGRRSSRWDTSALLSNVWIQLGVLALGCFLAFWLNLGGYPLFDVDEPRYAQAAYEMLERGDWITPYFNGVVRFDKPVFFYWLIALAYKWFGVSEFAARSVSALSATLMVMTVYGLGSKVAGLRYGFLSALVLLSSVMMIGIGRMSITDMNLALWMTLTTASLYLVAHYHRGWWLAAGILAGIGILTKGPVAIVLPGAVLVLYSLLTGRFKRSFLTPWFLLAVMIALVLPMPWYFAAYDANGQVFLDAVYHHNVSRFSGAVNYHIKPFWYYIPVVLVGFLPWVFFLPAAVRTAWRWGKFQFTLRQPSPLVSMLIYSAVWAVTVFLFFTVAKTKLLTYVLPMFPALALFMGGAAYVLTQADDQRIAGIMDTERPFWQMSGWIFVLIQLVAVVVLLFIMDTVLPPEAIHLATNPVVYSLIGLMMLGVASAMGLFSRQKATSAVMLIALTISVVAGGLWWSFVPQVNALTQGDMMRFVELAGEAPQYGRLGIYEITRPSLTFYTHKPIPHIARKDSERMAEIVGRSQVNAPVYLITKNKLVDDLIAHLPVGSTHLVVKKGQVYSLLSVHGQGNIQGSLQAKTLSKKMAAIPEAEESISSQSKGAGQSLVRHKQVVVEDIAPVAAIATEEPDLENKSAVMKASSDVTIDLTQSETVLETVSDGVRQLSGDAPLVRHKGDSTTLGALKKVKSAASP